MAKEKFDTGQAARQPAIGHMDHGKAAPTAAITKVLSEKFGGQDALVRRDR